MTKATAQKDHLTSIADLAPIASHLTFGAPAAFQTRPDGIPALKRVYGVTFGNFTALSASGTVTVTALKNGTIDAGDIFSTDPSFAADGFVALTDPKNMFAAQNVTPIVSYGQADSDHQGHGECGVGQADHADSGPTRCPGRHRRSRLRGQTVAGEPRPGIGQAGELRRRLWE